MMMMTPRKETLFQVSAAADMHVELLELSGGQCYLKLKWFVSSTECELKCVCGQESKRAYVIPSRVEPLYKCYYRNGLVRRAAVYNCILVIFAACGLRVVE